MALTRNDIQKGVLSGSDAVATQTIGDQYKAQAEAQKDARDAALRQLLQGRQQQFEQAQQGRTQDFEQGQQGRQFAQADKARGEGFAHDDASQARQFAQQDHSMRLGTQLKHDELRDNIAQTTGLAGQFPNQMVKVGGVELGADKAAGKAVPLTEAQKAAERKAGGEIAQYDSLGGRATSDANIQALSEAGPKIQQRDAWDRVVGGGLTNYPTLQGFLAPKEKALADSIRKTGNMIARQTDPTPTKDQVERIMSQIYDPSSGSTQNADKLKTYLGEYKGKADAMEQASQRYKTTGYVTMQPEGAPAAAPRLPQAGPRPGDVMDGHQFMGGDPSDPRSWKQVR